MSYDVVIIGGGPAGLSAALNLGRARKHVLLCDSGPRRNAAAEHVHGLVTRDGITPNEFRRAGREQLEPYPNVETRDAAVEEIRGSRGSFELRLDSGDVVTARRIVLCTGMIDELPEIDGFRALWGRSIFICPYCHGWEVQNGVFGFLAPNAESFEFAILLRSWATEVVLLTDGTHEVSAEWSERLARAGVRVDERPIARVVSSGDRLRGVELADGDMVRLDVLFARPPQRHVPVVRALELALDASGFVKVDERRQTSLPGIYAAGDLLAGGQSAVIAAAAGAVAAATVNLDLTVDLAESGVLP